MTKSSYSPVPFADVHITGPFWRERLEVVLKRTIPSQHVKMAEVGFLELLKLPKPVPPLKIPRNNHGFTDSGGLGLGRRQVDRGGELRAVAPARSRHRSEDRRALSTISSRRNRRTAI